MRHRPYSVVLFDEIEKAHPEVFNVLLQVLDNGRLTDAKGRVINFKNTIIILTSNVGAQYIDKMQTMGFASGEKTEYENVKDKVLSALKDQFRPEFLNRLDEIIVFDILSRDVVKTIVRHQVAEVEKRLLDKDVTLTVSEKVIEMLAAEGYNPQYGARPLKRLIQTKILNPVASMIISNKVISGGAVEVDVKAGEIVFDVKKGKVKGIPMVRQTSRTK